MPTEDEIDAIVKVLEEHSARAGVMASPSHWAYQKDPETGKSMWFASCSGDWYGAQGCGWSTEPHVFRTKAEAEFLARRHVALEILAVTS